MTVCVQTKELTKCYGNTVAVGGLTLEAQTGEILGILGANGAGKSTTLYMLTGLVPATSGTVTIFGKDIKKQYLSIARRMGALLERPSFFDHLSARRNLKLLAKLSGKDITVDRALDRVGLLQVGGQKVSSYSHGMRQRLGLAQALLTEPELLILDEPTNGLDAEGAQEVLGLLKRLADEAKVTVVFTSHMLQEVETLADRVAILNKGRLLACEHTERLIAYDPSHVDVLVDAPETVAKRLLEQPWVESAHAAPGRVQVVLRNVQAHTLISYLSGSGFVLSGVIPRRRTLQDYFIKVLHP